MPTLKILSIYRGRKRKFAAALAQAKTELERFEADLRARYGKKLLAAMCREPFEAGKLHLGKAPELSEEGIVAVSVWRTLEARVVAVRKKIRTPDCWFREQPGIVSVLGATGLSWGNVHERCTADGWLPLSGVLWLLKVLRASESRNWLTLGGYSVSEKWRRRLDRRRRRLIRLLHTAAMLEEDVTWEYRRSPAVIVPRSWQ